MLLQLLQRAEPPGPLWWWLLDRTVFLIRTGIHWVWLLPNTSPIFLFSHCHSLESGYCHSLFYGSGNGSTETWHNFSRNHSLSSHICFVVTLLPFILPSGPSTTSQGVPDEHIPSNDLVACLVLRKAGYHVWWAFKDVFALSRSLLCLWGFLQICLVINKCSEGSVSIEPSSPSLWWSTLPCHLPPLPPCFSPFFTSSLLLSFPPSFFTSLLVFLYFFLTFFTWSEKTSVTPKIRERWCWVCRSLEQCLTSMLEVLGLSPSTGRVGEIRKEENETMISAQLNYRCSIIKQLACEF